MPKLSKEDAIREEELLLSKERTILSFMRTGLGFVTAGAAIYGFFQNLPLAMAIGYILVGVGFVEVFESMRRLVSKQRELEKLKVRCRVNSI
jgi:uncharacterized membrane protein YidH (DUF202 family)